MKPLAYLTEWNESKRTTAQGKGNGKRGVEEQKKRDGNNINEDHRRRYPGEQDAEKCSSEFHKDKELISAW